MTNDKESLLNEVRLRAIESRADLEKIGDGDWTPQDSSHLRLVQAVENFLSKPRSFPTNSTNPAVRKR